MRFLSWYYSDCHRSSFCHLNRWIGWRTLAKLVCLSIPLNAADVPNPPPLLRVQQISTSQVRIAWPGTLTGFALEEAATLDEPIMWQPTLSPVNLVNGEFTVELVPGTAHRFFRLVSTGPSPLTRIVST